MHVMDVAHATQTAALGAVTHVDRAGSHAPTNVPTNAAKVAATEVGVGEAVKAAMACSATVLMPMANPAALSM